MRQCFCDGAVGLCGRVRLSGTLDQGEVKKVCRRGDMEPVGVLILVLEQKRRHWKAHRASLYRQSIGWRSAIQESGWSKVGARLCGRQDSPLFVQRALLE